MFLPKRIHTKEEDMKAIIFDLDGTLWSSVDLMLEVWKSGSVDRRNGKKVVSGCVAGGGKCCYADPF